MPHSARPLLILMSGLLLGTWLVAPRSLPSPARERDDGRTTGRVVGARGPVAGARVRWQGDPRSVLTDAEGRFTLVSAGGRSRRVTAWKEGYLIAGAGDSRYPLELALQPLPVGDNESYVWVDPAPDPARGQNCGNCHREMHEEWAASAHARSVTNRHFLNVYDGSTWRGDGGRGWNLLAEYPDGAGVCTACHAPTVAFGDPAYFDLRLARGTAARGVHCDFCHKVVEVADGQVGLTHGRFGLQLLRPGRGQLFMGPLDDVDRGEDAFAPVYHDSRYCASCHEGTVFGVHVYGTYSEWRESPAGRAGRQCQDCHMAPTGALSDFAPGKGGIERDPRTLASHRFPGGTAAMLRSCLDLTVRVRAADEGCRVEIDLLADQVGHRVPTGFSDRQLVLAVEAVGRDGERVRRRAGRVLPPAAGASLEGVPGRLFAKQLSDFDGHRPVPFWRARPEMSDTRLRPGERERLDFDFGPGADRVRVRLLYRRFWEETARTKGWPDNESVLLDHTVPVNRGQNTSFFWLSAQATADPPGGEN